MANRLFPERPYTSRKLTDTELSTRLKQGCPSCGSQIVQRQRLSTDRESGRKKFAGTFMGCKGFGKGCDANYSLSIDTNVEKFYE